MRKFSHYLVGYYGMHNAGDDALMLASMYGISTLAEHTNICVSATSTIYDLASQTLPPTLKARQSFRGQNRLKHYANALRSDTVVFGGGSVMHNSHDLKMKLDMLKFSGTGKSRAVGVSVGPFVDTSAERHCAELLNRLDFVGVRDQKSYDIVQSLAPNANCQLTFDLAPSLVSHPRFKALPAERSGILVNVCPIARGTHGNFDVQADERRIDHLADALIRIWNATGERISVISLNGHHEFGDDRLCELLVRKVSKVVPSRFIQYHTDTFSIIQLVGSFKACLSMRLHGNVFAFMTETPSFSLNYHPKCNQWCEQIGLPQQNRCDMTDFDPQTLTDQVIDGLENGFAIPTLTVDKAVQRSLSNWS
ncbi:polysaccharide pyruvyl transferase family protein [Alteromonas sp. ASW11-36]|uniref:Polysaccharide pyruvyl transferase family protein n=1 Tax=Alteromonas arenosi TaxID=3055817 RepID=A0ABT7ST02_9ALTE|nr:polysaccharide pyruvyl transferase family protein [Alteromonas sp. ASW11-36]MDM7859313.1 polysaccharide pyruvyl transferase family protein [Alteromonas sp. ASW11-36]